MPSRKTLGRVKKTKALFFVILTVVFVSLFRDVSMVSRADEDHDNKNRSDNNNRNSDKNRNSDYNSNERQFEESPNISLLKEIQEINSRTKLNEMSMEMMNLQTKELKVLYETYSKKKERFVELEKAYNATQQNLRIRLLKLENDFGTLNKEYNEERTKRMNERAYGQRKLARMIRAEKQIKHAAAQQAVVEADEERAQKEANEAFDAKEKQMEEDRLKNERVQRENEMKERGIMERGGRLDRKDGLYTPDIIM